MCYYRAGPIGIMAAAVVRHAGASRCHNGCERLRLELARKMGDLGRESRDRN